MRLFLGGDVMTGRGIDQIQRRPGNPALFERSVNSAQQYVALAEKVAGPIPRNVAPEYIWGDALAELERLRPDARIANLETAITTANDPWPNKRVHYRMHPANVACLAAARFDCCTLANNHVLDWGYVGLRETLATLRQAGIAAAGVGDTQAQARTPAVIDRGGAGRVLVFAWGSRSSGVPKEWLASPYLGGINGIDEDEPGEVTRLAAEVRAARKPGDVVIASIHWGRNWGYEVPESQRRLARALIDEAGVDVVFGHSSHHVRPIEIHSGKLILYGCGDLIDDYEGVAGNAAFRPDLGALYLPEIDPATGRLLALSLRPTRIRRFQVSMAAREDGQWMRETLDRECRPYGTRVRATSAGSLEITLA